MNAIKYVIILLLVFLMVLVIKYIIKLTFKNNPNIHCITIIFSILSIKLNKFILFNTTYSGNRYNLDSSIPKFPRVKNIVNKISIIENI